MGIKAHKILNDIIQGASNGDLSLDALQTIESVARFAIEKRGGTIRSSVRHQQISREKR